MQAAKLLEIVLGPDGGTGLARNPMVTDTVAFDYLNQALWDVASTVLIPALSQSGTIACVAGENLQALPSDFHRNLVTVTSSGLPWAEARIFSNPVDLFAYIDTDQADGGPVRAVAVSGQSLVCYPAAQEGEVLSLRYFRHPDSIVNGNSEVSCIPDHLQRETLINRVMSLLFEEREDALDGGYANSQYFAQRYEQGLAKLRLWIRETSGTVAMQQARVQDRRFG